MFFEDFLEVAQVFVPIPKILCKKQNKKSAFLLHVDLLSPVNNFWKKKKSPKKFNCIFASVPWFLFLFKIFSTLITLHCLLCIYICFKKIIVDWFVNVMFVETISRWNCTMENIIKKTPMFFGSKFGISTFQIWF